MTDLNPDSQAILLLCSYIGLPSDVKYKPLTLKEWNVLACKLQILSLSPGDLIGLSSQELEGKL